MSATVMKVWSADWYNDRDAVIAKITAEIDSIKSPLQIEDDEPIKYEIKQELAEPSADTPPTYKGFRTDERESTEVSPDEFKNAIRYVLRRDMSLPEDDLRKSVVSSLGFKRTGSVLAQSFSNALAELVASGEVVEKGGVYMMG